MRPAQKSNRSRGRGNRKGGGGGGGGNNINRVFDSAGPDGKVRGTPQQIIDKYLSLARDAQTSGDRVAAENFLQHAEHYQRILIQANATQEQARREAQEAATDQAERNNETAPTAEAAPKSNPQVTPQNAPQPDVSPEPSAIGGMTTIDSGPTESVLLVEGDENTPRPAQPRRNGEGRTRRPRQKSDPAKAAKESPAQEETPPKTSEAAATPAEG